jgi:hypothetical protein
MSGQKVSRFDPRSLSSLAIDPRPCELPFGLTWSDLRPVLPDLAGPTSGHRALISHEKQGLDAGDNSCIVTLQWLEGGALRERIVFIKQTEDPNAWETAKYRLLASRGVPTAQLLGSVSRAGAEVIVLEFLPRIGVDFQSPKEVRALLELVACLNAVDVDASEVEPKRPVVPNDEFDSHVLIALQEIEHDGVSGASAELLFDAYQRAQYEVATARLVLSHGELYFQQIGWSIRDEGEELVLIDLATMALRPLFTDVASVLPLLVQQTGRSETELFGVYLDALGRFGATTDPSSDPMRELRLVRVTSICWALPWLARASKDRTGFDLRGELTLKVSCLCDDVNKLA